MLDACVLINLVASDEIENIFSAAESEFRICEVVMKESYYLRSDDLQEESVEAIQLDSLVNSEMLGVCAVETEVEEALYVNYAGQVDDGEAMSIAIAEARGYAFATDDRKARRIFLEATGSTDRLISTSELVRKWAEREAIPAERLRSALLGISARATFIPRRIDPNFQWWVDNSN